MCRAHDRSIHRSPNRASGETCGNCADDDGDGFVDYEDPDCCTRTLTLDLQTFKLNAPKPKLLLKRLSLTGLYAGVASESFDPLSQDTSVQVSDASGQLLCTTIEASHWMHRTRRKIAFWGDGKLQENVEYELAGTPCEKIVSGEATFFPRAVAAMFPDDLWLAEQGIVSYFGAPLVATDGSTIGFISLLHTQPMDEANYPSSLLHIFAVQAAAALETEITNEALRASDAQLQMATLSAMCVPSWPMTR